MTALFEDNFEIYGGDTTKLLDGVWAELGSPFGVGSVTLQIPAWEEESRYWASFGERGHAIRAIFPSGGTATVGMWIQFYFPALPDANNRIQILAARDSSNDTLFSVVVQSDGTISLAGYNTDHTAPGTELAASAAPVIVAGTAHTIQLECNLTAGDIEVRVDGIAVISLTGSGSLSGTAVGVAIQQTDASSGTYPNAHVKALACYSLTGTYNNSWPAISGVKTVLIDADTATDNLTPRPRDNFSSAVAFNDRTTDTQAGIRVTTKETAFDYGTGDYTLEGWFRFRREITSGEEFGLFGVWNEQQDRRSHVLKYKASDVDGGGLQFQYTTSGAVATIGTIHDVNWTPQIGVWYHIAVCRDSSTNTNRLFIDGVQQGPDQTDTFTYYGGNLDHYVVGNIASGNISPTTGTDAFDGHISNHRVTKGVARYTSNFTPPTTWFPEDVGGDANFNSVSLLLRLDDPAASPPVDLSSNTFTMEEEAGFDVVSYGDSLFSYQAAGTNDPIDDRYLESGLPKAQGILTLSANAADGDTVTMDTQTYTFKTTLTPTANEVLIGPTIDDSLEHLMNAVIGGPGSGTDYAAATATNSSVTAEYLTPASTQLTATAINGGSAGNSIATTETGANMAWGGATLSGGADLPGASEFGIQSLPPDATGVRWISIRHRSYVNDGSATIETKLDVSGSESAAGSNGMTTDPQYYIQRVEEDPNTTSALTVSSIENAKIKIERTA